jgi:pSer/pThr/pTyr-binding forkhead associated (FHA) protein
MPRLIIGETAHEIATDGITIGRAPDNIIVLTDRSVSNRHAVLRLANGSYYLKDLGSTNGTRVNGIPITETTLRFDDRIRFGVVESRFESDARGSRPLPPLEQIAAKAAESSTVPANFQNASPFPRRQELKDGVRAVLFAAAAVALLAFFGSMVAVWFMHGP